MQVYGGPGCGKWVWHVLKNGWHVDRSELGRAVDMGATKKGWHVNCGQQQRLAHALIIRAQETDIDHSCPRE